MTLPSEFLTLAAASFLAFKIFHEKKLPEIFAAAKGNKLLIFSGLWMLWLGVSAVFSTMPLVSWKYFSVEFGQWFVFFVGMVCYPKFWLPCLRLFIFSMVGVVGFSLTQHYFFDFRPDQSNLAPMPFFPDHTLYSAVLAMLMPFIFPIFKNEKWSARLVFALFLVAIYFSFCRAAWASLAAAAAALALLKLLTIKNLEKIRLPILLSIFAIAVATFFIQKNKNQPQPTADGNARDLASQIRSMANFTTDASNLERLNRYSCALRMAAEKPIFGFGTGTFQFQYLQFQRAEEMTRISVVEPIRQRDSSNFGRGGGAHSEFFQSLAEAGCLGLLFWSLLLGWAVFSAGRGYFFEKNWLFGCIFFSLLTFGLHGVVNNFLHDGRLAALFWGQLAVLARWDYFFPSSKKSSYKVCK